MRKTILIALLLSLGLSINSYATDKSTNDNNENIKTLATLEVSKNDVKSMFGEPARITAQKGKSTWSYKNDNYYLMLEWNEDTKKLHRYSYSAAEGESGEWATQYITNLEIEETTVSKAISMLGIPKNMNVEDDDHRMQYFYNNRTQLRLHFKNGLLFRYELERT